MRVPWWTHRQLAPCAHQFRVHEVFTVTGVAAPFLRFHACIICGERGFLELPKEQPQKPDQSKYGPRWNNAPPGWAEEQERLLRENPTEALSRLHHLREQERLLREHKKIYAEHLHQNRPRR
jgi:hypothetical protein